MAINIPIITEFVDQGLKSAQGAFDNFRTKVGDADGAMGKFKAAGTATFDTIKANAGAMALGAGAAIAGFAIKAIGDFKDLALEVGKFSDATGLAAEDASRWVEVAGDMGIESNTVETAINKMNREIAKGSDAFEKLGIEIERTSGGAVDVNKTFLNTIDALNNIRDPAQKAKVATELLGRGWMELSELVAAGSDDLSKALSEVSDAKIIDEEEIEKAKELRDNLDNLADQGEELALALGEALIPVLSDLLEALNTVIGAVKTFFNALDDVSDFLSTNNIDAMIDARDEMIRLNGAWEDGTRAMIDAYYATEDLTDALSTVDETLAELKGNVDDRQAWRNLQDEFQRTLELAIKAFSEGTPEALRDSEAALDRTRLAVGEYIAELESIPEDQKTEIIASLDNANIQQIEEILNNLARTRQAQIVADAFGVTPVTPNPWQPGQVPFAPQRPASAWMGTNVNVNVAGSVIAENDLVETVRKGLVNSQRNGAQLIYQNT